MAHKMSNANPDDTLRAAFAVFDSNGDGTISAEEVRRVVREMGEPVTEQDMAHMLSEIDEDGDGMINYAEFAKSVTREIRASGFSLGL
jgi:calmodulin